MRSGLLSIILVTMILGFIVGLYTTLAFPNLGQSALRLGVATAGGTQGPPAIAGPRRAVQQFRNDNPYDHVVLLLGFAAIYAAITTGIGTRLEGDYRIRPIADAVITLAVISLMLLAIELVVLLFTPILS